MERVRTATPLLTPVRSAGHGAHRRRAPRTLAAAGLLLVAACASTSPRTTPPPTVTDPPTFEALELELAIDGTPQSVPVRLRGPLVDPDAPRATYPLLVFLHGSGERGDDNTAQLAHLPERLVRPEWHAAFDGYVLAVQCPAGARWVELPWDAVAPPRPAHPSPALARVSAAIDVLLATRPIDPRRVHLTGLSMGGQGAWDLAMRRPDTFASLCTVCGGGDPRSVALLEELPIQVWHGMDDPVVPLERSGAMVEALRDLGVEVRYEVLPEGTGHAAWEAAYAADSPYWSWLRSLGR